MSSERNTLPGAPSNRLIADVRRQLASYNIRPGRQFDRRWRATWEWAYAIAVRQTIYLPKRRNRPRWPIPSEIATQYVALILAEMQANRCLGLPFRASECVTGEVARRLSEAAAAPNRLGRTPAVNLGVQVSRSYVR